MDRFYGTLDLTVLGKIVRQHSGLVRKVMFKDGEHQLLNIDIFEKQQPDQFGNVAAIKASCKASNRKEGLNYYIANLKISDFQDEGRQQTQSAVSNGTVTSDKPEENVDADDLPF